MQVKCIVYVKYLLQVDLALSKITKRAVLHLLAIT
jgi:hypothetical protein